MTSTVKTSLKGVILAGGRGTRLYPCTSVVNKHLLPIGNKPMIYYPLETLRKAGCLDILIVTGGENPSEIMRLIKDGKHLGFNSVLYAYQEDSVGGIAQALSLAQSFINKDEKFIMILGDNLILNSDQQILTSIQSFLTSTSTSAMTGKAHIFLKEVDNASSFGVVELDGSNGLILNIIEKPLNPPTNKAVIGLYLYDYSVFDVIKNFITPSSRNEMEITDVNMYYVQQKCITFTELTGSWLDTGSFDSLYKANILLQQSTSN